MCMRQVFDGTLFTLTMCNAFLYFLSFSFILVCFILLDKILITVYQFHNLLGEKTYRTEYIYTQVVCKEVHYYLVGNGNKLEAT